MQQGGYTITPKSAQAIGEGLEAQIAALIIRIEELEAGGGSGSDGWVEAFKPADTARDDATIADDPDLVLDVEVGTYAIHGYIGLEMTDVEGLQFALSGPASSMYSIAYGRQSMDIEYREDSTPTILPNAASKAPIIITGTITFTAAGSLAFQWAQETDVPDAVTTVFKGSWLRAKLLA